MISKYGRSWIATPLNAIAKSLDATGISPNALTLIGFVLTLIVATVLALGYLFWGGVLLICAALFDTLDGAVARYAGKTSVFGAFFDSVMDRFSEAVTLIGLMVYYLTTPDPLQPVLLLAVALVGSLMVSYTRARAEAVGIELKEGFFQRTERIIALVIGLVLSPFLPWIMLRGVVDLGHLHEPHRLAAHLRRLQTDKNGAPGVAHVHPAWRTVRHSACLNTYPNFNPSLPNRDHHRRSSSLSMSSPGATSSAARHAREFAATLHEFDRHFPLGHAS